MVDDDTIEQRRVATADDFTSSVPRGTVISDSERMGTTPVTTATTPVRTVDTPPVMDRTVARTRYDADDRYSIGASFLGWCVAAFWVLVLTTLVAAAAGYVGAANYTNGTLGYVTATNIGIGAAIAFIVAQFLAYVIGGYAAGRMGPVGRGASEGIGTAVWGVVVAVLLALAGYALATSTYANYFGAYFPRIDWGALGTYGWTMLVLTLAAMFLGGWLGGLLGTRGFSGMRTTERRTYRRGRTV